MFPPLLRHLVVIVLFAYVRYLVVLLFHAYFKRKSDIKIRLTMLYLSGFELYSRWVPLFIDRSSLPNNNNKETSFLNNPRLPLISPGFTQLSLFLSDK